MSLKGSEKASEGVPINNDESCLDPRPIIYVSLSGGDDSVESSELLFMRKIALVDFDNINYPNTDPKESEFYKVVFGDDSEG